MVDPRASQTDGVFSGRYWWRHPMRALRLCAQGGFGPMAPLERGLTTLPEPVQAIFAAHSEAETNRTCTDRHFYGGHLQRERVTALAEWSVRHHPGDLVEIGACRGHCTRLLGEVAGRHGRKLIVVDPWITGTQDCAGGEYEEFQQQTAGCREHLELLRHVSDAPEVFAHLRGRPLAFAFVDGLHTFEACWSDFLLVRATTGLVVADDARYNVEVLRAARQRARQFGWRIVQPAEVREALLLPPGA